MPGGLICVWGYISVGLAEEVEGRLEELLREEVHVVRAGGGRGRQAEEVVGGGVEGAAAGVQPQG